MLHHFLIQIKLDWKGNITFGLFEFPPMTNTDGYIVRVLPRPNMFLYIKKYKHYFSTYSGNRNVFNVGLFLINFYIE